MKQEENNISPINFMLNDKDFNKHPNILIAAGLWDNDRFEAAKTCYKFMRTIDDLIDDHKAKNVNFLDCEKKAYENQILEWVACLNGKHINDPFLEEVVDTINRYNIPIHLFHVFAKSMIYDINNEGFATYPSFLEYAEGASVSPAAIFVHLCCLNEKRTGYVYPEMNLLDTARPCAIFSYIVHIIRDFEKDYKENLLYFSRDLLEQYGLNNGDLYKVAYEGAVPIGFRNLANQYCAYAEIYKQQTIEQISRLSSYLKPQYLLSLQVIYELYLLVFQRIKNNPASFSTNTLNPTSSVIIDHVNKLTSNQFV